VSVFFAIFIIFLCSLFSILGLILIIKGILKKNKKLSIIASSVLLASLILLVLLIRETFDVSNKIVAADEYPNVSNYDDISKIVYFEGKEFVFLNVKFTNEKDHSIEVYVSYELSEMDLLQNMDFIGYFDNNELMLEIAHNDTIKLNIECIALNNVYEFIAKKQFFISNDVNKAIVVFEAASNINYLLIQINNSLENE